MYTMLLSINVLFLIEAYEVLALLHVPLVLACDTSSCERLCRVQCGKVDVFSFLFVGSRLLDQKTTVRGSFGRKHPLSMKSSIVQIFQYLLFH